MLDAVWGSPPGLSHRRGLDWGTYRFRLGGVEQVFEGFVCCPQQRPDRAGPFLSVFLSSLFRIVAQECSKEAGVGVLHQLYLHRDTHTASAGTRHGPHLPSQSKALPRAATPTHGISHILLTNQLQRNARGEESLKMITEQIQEKMQHRKTKYLFLIKSC